MSDYQFTIPFPPSVNGYWRSYKGRQIISSRGRDYRQRCIEAMKEQRIHNEKLNCRLGVYVRFHAPDKRRRDLDNYLKAALDGITHAGFWVDDEQIDKLTIKRAENVLHGELVVTVECKS